MKYLISFVGVVIWLAIGLYGSGIGILGLQREVPGLYSGRYERGNPGVGKRECAHNRKLAVFMALTGPFNVAASALVFQSFEASWVCPNPKVVTPEAPE